MSLKTNEFLYHISRLAEGYLKDYNILFEWHLIYALFLYLSFHFLLEFLETSFKKLERTFPSNIMKTYFRHVSNLQLHQYEIFSYDS